MGPHVGAKQLVNVGYKSLAQKMHPVAAGSTIEMASLNDVRCTLLDLVDRIGPSPRSPA